MDLLLFDGADDSAPAHVISADPKRNRTFHYWHVFVEGLRSGQLYVFRAHGPYEPQNGMRFDPSKVLLDPYGLAVAIPDRYDRCAAARAGDNSATALKSVLVDTATYD